ncbi:MAG: ABC transporter substrate-binding protein, partial [Actinomycetota bacterium]|nr:ABC transporter substrate-binding protein [Actinomycetota bacterium]
GPASSGGPLPCAAPSTAPGITDDEIAVATINTLSGPVPGLGASHLAATQAYAAYRNATGGVCGRRIRVVAADDGADTARYRSIVEDLNRSTFALHAGIAAGGDGGAEPLAANGIPAVGTGITPLLIGSPTYYGVRPVVPDFNALVPKYRYLRDQGVRTAAVVFISAASSPVEAGQHAQMMEAAGIKVVLNQPLPLSTLSYDSAARAVANSKADYLFFLHDQGGSASMARSLVNAGYKPKFADYIVAYGSKFIELAGPAAEGSTSFIDTLPAEDGGVVPEHKAFLEWMERIAPQSVIDPFAALGWAGAKAMFDTLEELPGPIDRAAYLTQLAAVGTYDAGGLLGPVEFGAQQGRGCVIGMVVRDGKWQRLTPERGFLC